MNKVNLIGRLAKEGELKYSPAGKAFYRNTIAVNRKFKKGETDFIHLVAFINTAELMGNHLKKGDQVGIEGHIQTSSYEKDEQKIFTTQVVVDSITFVGNKKEHETQSSTALDYQPLQNGTEIDDSDLPF
jgi:single-strand DNA-binding protein